MTQPQHCPTPRTLATGERECASCGRIWDKDEPAPECDRVAVVSASDQPRKKQKPKYVFRNPAIKT